MGRLFFFGVVFLLSLRSLSAQNTRENGDPFATDERRQGGDFSAAERLVQKRGRYLPDFKALEEDYYKRREERIRAYRRASKALRKERYSDPSYFGHRRKPKKRKPGKQRYCKECGVMH